ncbi:MAG: NACHT domain-containing protein [Dolichospermum sp. DET50]|nr:NACHT domain-containing protein [Dolichospermum sp. DET66]MBS3032831.1 NACHT domain-containing protein [Dolichospermum sp. DET67]MBS3038037.1 NACHT domain-containing protein [Dolichospermum sp. DET50]QSX69946.1 MAG: NACHT domain-containing protein [Dolichospermum sp. DET69]
MSGSGGNGGYEYQARVTAYVAAHILTQQKLGWIEHSNPDIPIAVAAETNGPGDDIKITLEDGTTVEVQVKHRLQKNEKFWKAILKLAHGLAENPYLYCILLTDSTASGTFKDELRQDLKRLGQGRTDDLTGITDEVINEFAKKGIPDNQSLFRRLLIIVVDLEDDTQGAKFAQEMLLHVLADKNQLSQAWNILVADASKLITNRGRRDAEGIARLLGSKSIQLSANSSNPAITAKLYRKWLEKTTSDFIVLGIEKKLSIETDWISLKVKQNNGDDDQAIFKAEFIPELYDLTVVVGNPGSGKSTLLKCLAHQLCVLEKKVLRVSLKHISNLCRQQGKTFEDAIFKAAADSSGVNEDQLKFSLRCPDYLLLDGFDECDDGANIASKLTDWAIGSTMTKIIITTRPGYGLEHFSDWEQVEILPLEISDILKFAKRIFEIHSINKETLKEQEILFENWLINTQTASLAARNPLLLGFLTQLFLFDANSILNRASIYGNIVHLLCQQDTQDRESIKINKQDEPIAQRTIEIAGWQLMYQPEVLESEFNKILTNALLSELNSFTKLEMQTQVKKYISFWEQRRIFERNKVGLNDTINFIHLTLCEYAAGKYVSNLDDQKICTWLEGVRQDIKWQEVILFAAGLGKVDIIVNHLLELDNLENINSTDILLAAKALTEVNDAPFELVKAVVNRLQIQLESPNPSVVINAAKALLSLIPQATDLIGNIAQNLSNHTQSWTRLAVVRLVLECGDKYVDLSILKEVIDECIAEPARIYSPFTPRKLKDYGKYGREFQNQVLLQGFQLLLKKQPNLETAKHIKEEIRSKKLSSGIIIDLSKILHNHISEQLKNNDQKEDRKDWSIFSRELIQDNAFMNPQNLLTSVKRREQIKYADKSFLEAVLRVTDNKSNLSISLQQQQELIALGILVKGMGWLKMPIWDWDVLSENNDLEAVDSVIKGVITALNIELQKIAIEALIALKQIEFHDLDIIESALNGEKMKLKNSSQTFDWAWDKILEISDQNYISLHSKIPEVPADPKWERAKEIYISPENLVRALKHPSQGIYQNATLLLMNGVGGSEAINLIEELFKENKDNEQVVWAVSNIAPHLLEDE